MWLTGLCPCYANDHLFKSRSSSWIPPGIYSMISWLGKELGLLGVLKHGRDQREVKLWPLKSLPQSSLQKHSQQLQNNWTKPIQKAFYVKMHPLQKLALKAHIFNKFRQNVITIAFQRNWVSENPWQVHWIYQNCILNLKKSHMLWKKKKPSTVINS